MGKFNSSLPEVELKRQRLIIVWIIVFANIHKLIVQYLIFFLNEDVILIELCALMVVLLQVDEPVKCVSYLQVLEHS
jgi:hypothetical protein